MIDIDTLVDATKPQHGLIANAWRSMRAWDAEHPQTWTVLNLARVAGLTPNQLNSRGNAPLRRAFLKEAAERSGRSPALVLLEADLAHERDRSARLAAELEDVKRQNAVLIDQVTTAVVALRRVEAELQDAREARPHGLRAVPQPQTD